MGCKRGLCEQYKIKKRGFRGSIYKNGGKRCSNCEVFIKWEGIWCPCCGYRLRSQSYNMHYTKNKEKLLARIE